MIPFVNKKIKRKAPTYQGREPKHDFLKHWTIVRKWALANYDITSVELELIMFLYSEKLFTRNQFETYSNFLTWDKNRFYKLLEKNYIHVWRKGGSREQNLYEVSFKGKKLINSIYKKLLGLEPLPESKERNKVFRKTAPFAQKTLAIAIKDHNAKIRKPRLSPELQ